jgi:predicted nucleic acid-binding protein
MIAVFDACVFYPGSLRDLLLHLAHLGAVHARWSDDIHEEWICSMLRDHPDLKRSQLETTRKIMNEKFRHGCVKNYEHIIDTLDLPDPDDRHVLAVAIRAEASVIVTCNLDDFPQTALAPYNIEAISPDEFIDRLKQMDSHVVVQAACRHRSRLTRPPKTVEEYLATLEEQGLHETVEFLRKHSAEI